MSLAQCENSLFWWQEYNSHLQVDWQPLQNEVQKRAISTHCHALLLPLLWTHLHQIFCKSLQLTTEKITVPTPRKELGNRFHIWSWKCKKKSGRKSIRQNKVQAITAPAGFRTSGTKSSLKKKKLSHTTCNPWASTNDSRKLSTNNHALRHRDDEFSKSLISRSNNFRRQPKVAFALSECTKQKHACIQAQRRCKKKSWRHVTFRTQPIWPCFLLQICSLPQCVITQCIFHVISTANRLLATEKWMNKNFIS